MQTVVEELELKGANARKASRAVAKLSGRVRDQALVNIADSLVARRQEIVAANEADLQAGRAAGLSEAVLGRLALSDERIQSLADDVRGIAAMPDPISETFDAGRRPNGLQVARRRVPLGVIGAIYESRPNVTIDIGVLCLKSGNAVILRGGKEAFRTNKALVELIRDSIESAGIPHDAVQFVESTDRALVGEMLAMSDYIDLMIPRGGAELVRRVAEEASMPAVTGGVGVCHIYVDREADVDKATAIALNAKTSRPYACNALDTLLVHSGIASSFLPRMATEFAKSGVEMRCDRRALSILGQVDGSAAVSATNQDWGKEFLSLTAAVKVVDTLEEALEHIESYGSGHTDAIISEDYSAAMRFLDDVDSGVVIVNASTVFNDGGELGLGAEVAISTNKMHARGPMGLKELTSYKWTVLGTGQVRE